MLDYLDDLIWLFFPEQCAACKKPLFRNEECICTFCRYRLPKTFYHLLSDNPVARHFWGKTKFTAATAYFHFTKGQKVQSLIHHLKYKDRKDVGKFIGQLMGTDLRGSIYEKADLIVPVPLHPARLKQRGYNQSDSFAEGLSDSMHIKWSPETIQRVIKTETQTRKHRFERFRNMENVFKVPDNIDIRGKNLLIIDDVITTGSTLISCAEAALDAGANEIMFAAIAHAR